MASDQVRQAVLHDLPLPASVARDSELGILRHQMGLQRPSKSIREVITAMPNNVNKLAPCMLMSPLSIAQYLPVNQALFDVVIFDEASQITTWDAIGAIARGKQTIIVGDPKQLPPTNFFGRVESDEADEELQDHERDLESILDEAKASGIPTLQLNWHYRSRHESLIAFSNRHYYGNKLITFPSTSTNDTAVSFKYLPDAMYDRGKSRTNKAEAQSIADDAVTRLKNWIQLPEDKRPTLGIITFNTQQQSLIQDILDQALCNSPELEWFFSDERSEPVVVKNIESVQGDERDIMLFSVTFGRDKPLASISRIFGALNKIGGERRLNVAITRARQELVIYSSFRSAELNVEGVKYQGVRDLKEFLKYAEMEASVLLSESRGSVGDFESPFEEAVAAALTERGWQVVPQVGVSEFRIDLGIVHPDYPGEYLSGVECDGATYHRSHSAKDRDQTREAVLTNLGWNILRIWSPDWWYDSSGAVDRVDRALRDLLEESRAESLKDSGIVLDGEGTSEMNGIAIQKTGPAATEKKLFRKVQLNEYRVNPDTFHDESSTAMLRAMLDATLLAEGPIRAEILFQRIARSYGWLRTGAKIRDRLESLLGHVVKTEESTGRFYWPTQQLSEIIDFRYPESENDRRSIDQIGIAELRGLVVTNKELLLENDPVTAYANLIDVSRISQMTRARLQEAINYVNSLE
jgi:very-short-patch-repair endonuclease